MRGRRQQAERRVLVVDDEVAIRIAIETLLRKRGYRYSSAQNGSEAIQLLSSNVYDLVVTDLHMERRDTGLKVVRAARRKNPDTPVLVITGYGDVENAVAAMKAGAYDFMEKPFSIDDLEATIEAAISHKRGSQGPEPGSGSSDPFEGIIGRDPAIQQTFNTIRTIADTDATVLLTGESGVGKELFARAIHRSNPRRRRGYFVPVNCAAIPEGLIESELFGSVKGSFTNSTEDRPGMFRMADKGTILLDEIGDMPAMTQVKLLRVLNERQVRPVGASQAIPIDVRVIAATHRNLEQLVRDGKFREDLYYRLNVIPIAIPPLRARSEDIILIAMHFIERFNREDGRNIEGLSSDAQDVLLRYTWPGNIRELENTIRRTVIMCGDGVISADDLPDKLNFEISDEMLNAAPGLSTSMFEPSSHTLFVP
ncbi:MAG: sigma-54 dependent transcriptional regulator, partial [Myxococcota bacterium]